MNEHDKIGLTEKYIVLKPARDDAATEGMLRDIRSGGQSTLVRFKRTWCFVLSPEKDDEYGKASRAAMMAYADSIEGTNQRLSTDLRDRVAHILAKKWTGEEGS